MMWHLGKFIADTLEKRGGRRAGWTQTKLSEVTKISTSHISWIIHGESAGKKGPPELRIETLIALARGLGVTEQALIDAYKGKNPDLASNEIEVPNPQFESVLVELVRLMPDRIMLQALNSRPEEEVIAGLVKAKGADKVRQLLQEAKRRADEIRSVSENPEEQ